MGACSETSKKQKDSEKTNQSNDILEQNKKDKSKGEISKRKTVAMISK